MKELINCKAGSTLWLNFKVKVSFDRNVKVRRSELTMFLQHEVTRYLQELCSDEQS